MVKELSIIEIAKKQISIETNYSISDAIRIMHESKISRLIVKQNKKTVGIISEKDIINYQNISTRMYTGEDHENIMESY